MRVAPIIHTRTLSCDFNAEFRVRPDLFLDSDVKWTRKYVLQATSSIDSMQGERWVILDNGAYRVVGVVGFIKSITAKCNLDEERKKVAETMYCDDKGRLVYAFIGVVIDTQNNINVEDITYDFLWEQYEKYIYPVWNRTYQEVERVPFFETTGMSVQQGSLPQEHKVNSKIFFESNPVTDLIVFKNYLAQQCGDILFCSNLSDINSIRECDFTILTTTLNNITRIKRDDVKVVPMNSYVSEQAQTQVPETSIIESTSTEETKKKSLLVGVICLLIFVIIILMWLLLAGKSSPNTLLSLNLENLPEQMVSVEVVLNMYWC